MSAFVEERPDWMTRVVAKGFVPDAILRAAIRRLLAQRLTEESEGGAEARRARLVARLYVDVKPGDRYALTYLPGRGTELAKNGKPIGIVAGAEFAAAYFAIWLGDDPISTAFRDQLLAERWETPSRASPPSPTKRRPPRTSPATTELGVHDAVANY